MFISMATYIYIFGYIMLDFLIYYICYVIQFCFQKINCCSKTIYTLTMYTCDEHLTSLIFLTRLKLCYTKYCICYNFNFILKHQHGHRKWEIGCRINYYKLFSVKKIRLLNLCKEICMYAVCYNPVNVLLWTCRNQFSFTDSYSKINL